MKKLLLILSALVMIMMLSACAAAETPSAESEESTRIVTDAWGREVTLPEKIERIVPLGNTPRMAVYLGLADKFVGIGDCEIADNPLMAYAYPYRETWTELPVVGTDAMGESSYYAEELILAQPDVIICTYTADVADNIQTQTGIPVVAVRDATLFSPEYDEAFRILGEACGVLDRAEAVVEFIGSQIAQLRQRTEEIPDGGKPSVLAAGATFKGSHSIDGIYTNYVVFETLSANDVAEGIAGQTTAGGLMVDREQLLSWDPEIIFFDAGSMALVRADYEENPAFFEQLQAVRNGKLYQWANSTWHWSNVEIPLVSAYYVGALLYPEAFADVDFEAKAAEIFEFMIGQPDYLTVLEQSGFGYENITLGE